MILTAQNPQNRFLPQRNEIKEENVEICVLLHLKPTIGC